MSESLEFACRPVDWSVCEKITPGHPETPIYPGSVKGTCDTCGLEIWVGPKAQAVREARPDVPLVCFPCGMPKAHPGALFTVTTYLNAGNDYLPRDRH